MSLKVKKKKISIKKDTIIKVAPNKNIMTKSAVLERNDPSSSIRQ